jgi:hypothetical protein
MLATKTEQRLDIKSLVKRKKTFNFLDVTYVKAAISRGRVFEWYQRFSEQRGYLDDYEWPDRPLTIETEKKKWERYEHS